METQTTEQEEQKSQRKSKLEELALLNAYDPDSFPPDVELAKRHGIASKIGIISEKNENDLKETCICCGYEIDKEPMPICSDREELLFLGVGYPLFFEFFKWVFVFLGFSIIFITAYGSISNFLGSDCNKINFQFCKKSLENSCPKVDMSPCQQDSTKIEMLQICQYWKNGIKEIQEGCCMEFCNYVATSCLKSNFNVFNLPNKQFDYSGRLTTSIVVLVFSLVCVGLFQFMRKMVKATEHELDRGIVSPSDFTIIIRKLPQGNYTSDELKKFIEQWWKEQYFDVRECTIVKINIAYDIFEYSEFCQKKNQLVLKKRQMISYKKEHEDQYPAGFTEESMTELNDEIKATQQKIDQFEIEAIQNHKASPSQIAFVTFLTQKGIPYYLLILYATNTSLLQRIFRNMANKMGIKTQGLYFKEHNLNVERAPEPTDVNWENCGFSESQKTLARIKSIIFSLILMGVVFSVFLGLQYFQAKVTNVMDKGFTFRIISFLFSLFVLMVNSFLTIFMKVLTNMEKQSTVTFYNVSVGLKLLTAQFANTAVLTFVSNMLVTSLQSEEYNSVQDSVQRKSGVADDILYISFTNAFITPFAILFNPWYFLRLYKRSQIIKQGQHGLTTQGEAHNWFQGTPLFLYEKYCYLIRTIWLCGLYGSLTPLIFPISFMGLFLFYWVEKYLYSHAYARPANLGVDLNRAMIEMLEYFPFFLAIGTMIFNYVFQYEVNMTIHIIDFVSVGITSINFIFPMDKLNRMLFPEDDDSNINHDDYKKARFQFPNDYDRTNPITKELAIIEWQEILKQNEEGKLETYHSQQTKQPKRLCNEKNLINLCSGDRNGSSKRCLGTV